MYSAAVSIDLDGLYSYKALHGIADDEKDRSLMLKKTLPGILSFLEELNIKATFFIIGRDAALWEESITEIKKRSHEIANHSWTHPYGLAYASEEIIRNEILNTHTFLQQLGITPEGFRTPGYHLSSDILKILEQTGYSYSSSQMPGIIYPLAKYTVSFMMRIKGRKSATVMHPFTDIISPKSPYFPDYNQCYKPGNSKIVEIPVSTGKFPFVFPHTGAFLFTPPFSLLNFLPAPENPLILNLHAIDFWDDNAPLPSKILNEEPYLKIPLKKRLNILRSFISKAQKQNRKFTTLQVIANKQRIGT